MPTVASLFLAVIIAVTTWSFFFRARRARLPPGPIGNALVGNLFQIPLHRPWLYFEKLGRLYGPVVRLRLGWEEIVVLNEAEDAEELLSRRSKNYSSRRPLIYAGKYLKGNEALVLSPYGEGWRMIRSLFHSILQPRVLHRYEALQELESTKFLSDLLHDRWPGDLFKSASHFSASVIYLLAYGKRLKDDDKDLDELIEIMDGFVEDCYPGAHLVDTFPFLDYLPDFLAPWRKEALRKRDREMALFGRLADDARKGIESSDVFPECFASILWQQKEEQKLPDTAVYSTTGELFEAGTDTLASTIMWFFLAMLENPDVLQKAQTEIDSVVGQDGAVMPGLRHLEELPYCTAVLKETFRWMPVVPGGFPHYSEAEDVYKGFAIKAKTMVIPNIWSMHRNEGEFPNSSMFNPDRFLSNVASEVASPSDLTGGHYGFGFGRRICPGRYLASQTIWIAITRIMWAFRLEHATSPDGKPMKVDTNLSTTQIISRPLSFPLAIFPRTQRHADTIDSEWRRQKDIPSKELVRLAAD
ncbi:cytochrome P450 [Schizopora paradoxa]|uniref:Cytochrome P450 n=1 Tax=Schizopora paradoxa TaxID=27342 RepID=A0A0H2RNE7_9AGAM|nr:cytochrome P450 [Schizopora paradoxa]